MFDISGEDIARLNDTDLRTLVTRLALAEVRRNAGPASAVTAGGHQDATDGGIDVRVDLPAPLANADFVRRAQAGFQVKRPDMASAAIRAEMRFGGALRPSIAALAEAGGAYIIVSAQGTVDDQRLQDRRAAMREAVDDHPQAADLFLDFYDRTRLATWAMQYPGVAAWLQARIGGATSGWRAVGRWRDATITDDGGYLVNDAACLIDESSSGSETLAMLDGIARLRSALARPRTRLRLIGMSGLGKTRLVQALFEEGVGADPLDPGLGIYTDFSEDIAPSAREMARRLVDEERRAILIVDNCNPATHAQLAAICGEPHSALSLLTVEYDVRDDEPEGTDVFRLISASDALLEQWIAREFDHVSQVDRARIADCSAGNFRVARALAETVRRGETLGALRNQDLFARIFDQRHGHDPQLLGDAQLLAMLYSFEGEDVAADSELARLGQLTGRTADALYATSVALRQRGIVQARGPWRAVLPNAIANPLAADALARIPAATLDTFCAGLSLRMVKSLTRRLSYLHDSEVARAAITRWLAPGGLFADAIDNGDTGFKLIENLAPIAPELILDHLETRLAAPSAAEVLATSNRGRGRWGQLLKALAYEPALFERTAMLMARFVAVEPAGHNHDSIRRPFEELFHVRLSGTNATPEQRRAVVNRLLEHNESGLQRAGEVALGALLTTGQYTSTARHDFGARPRDFGWGPTTHGDIHSWMNEGIALAERFDASRLATRAILARHIRGLWHIPACHDAIERVARHFAVNGGWISGWTGLRAVHRYEQAVMPKAFLDRLSAIIALLAPDNLLDRARAIVLSGGAMGWDVVDGDPEGDAVAAHQRAADAAVEAGRSMAGEAEALDIFLPEVIATRRAMRAYGFGRGLALGSEDVATMWDELCDLYRNADPRSRDATMLTGFLASAHGRDPAFAEPRLEAAMADPELRPLVPSLQADVSLDIAAVDRLIRLTALPDVSPYHFGALRSGRVDECPPGPLAALLLAIAALLDGPDVAFDILQMRFFSAKSDPALLTDELLDCARQLILGLQWTDKEALDNHWLDEIIVKCLSGPGHEDEVRAQCARINAALAAYELHWHDAEKLILGLIKAQTAIGLDLFVLEAAAKGGHVVWELGIDRVSPLDEVDFEQLVAWAEVDPVTRYPLLGAGLPMFATEAMDTDTGLSERFLALLNRAPDRYAFLDRGAYRFSPSGWVGSLAVRLERRLALLDGLRSIADPAIDRWIAAITPQIQVQIAREREREARDEESFE